MEHVAALYCIAGKTVTAAAAAVAVAAISVVRNPNSLHVCTYDDRSFDVYYGILQTIAQHAHIFHSVFFSLFECTHARRRSVTKTFCLYYWKHLSIGCPNPID